MDRRHFFRSLIGVGAAVVAGPVCTAFPNRPTGVLEVSGQLSPAQQEAIREAFIQAYIEAGKAYVERDILYGTMSWNEPRQILGQSPLVAVYRTLPK